MCRVAALRLTAAERSDLLRLRDHAPQPYLRERAAAVLKVAAGGAIQQVARAGLLRPRDRDTVAAWVARFRAAGVAGLRVRPGRGRKPAFSPRRADGRAGG